MTSDSYLAPKPPLSHAVTITVAVDDNYIPHLAALVESIKDSFAKNRFLELFVLDGGICTANKYLLEKQFFLNFKSGSINFISCKDLYKDIPNHSYFTEAIFYRISLGSLFPNHKKILYLDTDIVVLDDVSKLFDIALNDQYIAAAVQDAYIKACIKQGPKKKIPRKIKAFKRTVVHTYVHEYLELKEKADRYFQSGVMLFNLDGLRDASIESHAREDLLRRKYWFPDQDVLNRHLQGRVLDLDMSWNTMTFLPSLYKHIDDEWVFKIKAAFLEPQIIHYAGADEKPWNTVNAPLAHYYWFFLRRTFWYEAVIEKAGS